MPIRKHSSRKLSGRRRSGRKLSGGRKVRTGPRGGKYVLRAGQKVYLSGGLACARRREKKDPKCEEEPGCKWEKGRKPGCFDPKKSVSKKQDTIKHKQLMNTLEVLDDNGNHIDSNEAYFRNLFNSRMLYINIGYNGYNNGLQITDSNLNKSTVNDGDADGYDALKVIFSNLHHFKHLENLYLSDRFESESGYDWVKGKRPPKLKTLHIGEFRDVPSSFTNGLDELVIEGALEEVPQHWISDQYFKHVHKNVRKVVFDRFNKESYDNQLEEGPLQRKHDKNITYLRRQFPGSEIVFRDEDNYDHDYNFRSSEL